MDGQPVRHCDGQGRCIKRIADTRLAEDHLLVVIRCLCGYKNIRRLPYRLSAPDRCDMCDAAAFARTGQIL